jgi:photosystem II stability/assembly factor-like uncharacterized protein
VRIARESGGHLRTIVTVPACSPPSRVLAAAVAGTFIASSVLLFVAIPSVAIAASRTWTLSASFPPVIADVEAISCFSATGCIVVGWTPADGPRPTPIELRTVDAGMLWTEVAIPHVVSMLNVVACAGTLCLAGGDGSVLLRSTDDGLTWDDVGLPFSITAVTALTCPSPTTCYAEGREVGLAPSGAIVATSNAGASWTGEYQIPTYLQSLWCSTSTSCYASYGSSYLTTTDGSTWGLVALPDSFPTLGVCPSATTCIGSSPSEGIVTSRDGGATWSTTDGAVVLTSLSCGSATTCVGTDGTNLVITTDGGATWSEQSPPYADEVLLGVACLSTTNCQAVGDDSVDTYPGRALLLDVTPSTQGFSPERTSDAVDAAVSASCASTAVCAVAAVDPYGSPMLVQTTDAGTAWTDLSVPPQFAQVDQVLCESATSCLVSGGDTDGQGSVWRTTDAGVTWVAGRVSASVGEVDRLQCPTSSRCEATGYLANSWTAVLMSSNAGRSWSTTPMAHTATDLSGIDCTTPKDCVAVGGRNGAIGVAFYSTDGGRRWRAAKMTGALRAFNGVSCVSSSVCIAASSVRHGSGSRGVIARSTDGGAKWSPVLAPGATAVVLSVSCWSPTGCEAVGQSGAAANPLVASAAVALATSNAGRSWVAQVLPMEQWTLNSVSCARGGACVAAGVGSFYPPSLPAGATILRLS